MYGDIYDWSILMFLIPAACCDRARGKIPNRLTAGGMAAALVLGTLRGKAWGDMILSAGAVLAVGFPLAVLKMMGAGDVKLMAVICAWLGLPLGGRGIVLGFFLAGGWSFFYMAVRGTLKRRMNYLQGYLFRCMAVRRLEPYMDPANRSKEDAILMGPFFCVGTAAVLAVYSFCSI